jgi:amidophosphoribosyltransferase
LDYFGLHSLQHRAGRKARDRLQQRWENSILQGDGLVQEVFNDEIIERLQGDISIGHVRYSTSGESHAVNAMPPGVYHKGGSLPGS